MNDVERHEEEAGGARALLSVELEDHAATIITLITREEAFSGLGPGTTWLKDRYEELAPLVVPAALACVRRGGPIPEETLAAVRASALRAGDADISWFIVLRGAVPAMRAMAAFSRSSCPVPTGQVALLLGRAALVAQELGSCWAEAWLASSASPSGHPDETAVVKAGAGRLADIDPVDTEMIRLAAAGESTEAIGSRLSYSAQTIKWRFARLMTSWNVRNRPALVAAAFARGVLVVTRRATGSEDAGRPRRILPPT